ncbi:MAG TPA: hypothetical protein VEB63_08480 [Chitinophagaceae bacterium]|nr:hypothetical protein [Chitinophagaceae bacterium]
MSKIYFGITFILTLISLGFLIYALVYAPERSFYRKYAFLFGLFFLITGRICISLYRTIKKTAR